MKMRNTLAIWVFLWTTALAGAAGAAFVESDPAGFGVDMSRVALNEKVKTTMSTALARCCGALNPAAEKDAAICSRLLALALLVDPECTAAIANAKRIQDGHPLPVDESWTPDKVAQALANMAGVLAEKLGKDHTRLAGYCYSLAADLAPRNDKIVASAARFAGQHGEPDWEAVFGATPARPTEANPPTADPQRVTIEAGIPVQGKSAGRFTKQQSQVDGLVVLDVLGRPSGRSLGIVGTIYPYTVRDRTHFELATTVGGQMRISFEEALSLVRTRHPIMEGGKSVRVSFTDKYTPKDGGSAGLAFSLLFFSLLDGIEIDPDIAVTGDVTVDWKVRKVGAVSAKISGARECGKKYVLIPDASKTAVEDMLVLDGPPALLGVQILSAATVPEAVEICRKDRLPQLDEALKLFAQFQSYAEKRDLSMLLRSPSVQTALADIVKKAPNHLSADCLLRMAKGWKPDRLSQEGSITEAIAILYPFDRQIRSERIVFDAAADILLANSVVSAERLSKVSSEKVQPLSDAIAGYLTSMVDYRLDTSKDTELADLLRKKGSSLRRTTASFRRSARSGGESDLRGAAAKVMGELDKLAVDREFIEALSR